MLRERACPRRNARSSAGSAGSRAGVKATVTIQRVQSVEAIDNRCIAHIM